MSLGSILVLLTAILGLYGSPQVSQSPELKAQVDSLAQSAIQQVTQALAQQQAPSQNDSPTVTFNIPTSTDNAQPIVINVTNPPVQQVAPVVNQPTLGSAPEVIQNSCTLTAIAPTGCDGMGNCATSASLSWSSQGNPGLGTLYNNYHGLYVGGVIQWDKIEDVGASGSRDGLQSFTNAKLVFADGTTCYATSTR